MIGFIIIKVICYILFLYLSFLYSGGETAFVSLSRSQIKAILDKKTKSSRPLFHWLRAPQEILSTILIGNNLVNVIASSLVASLAIDFSILLNYSSDFMVNLLGGINLFFLILFAEITPKIYFRKNPNQGINKSGNLILRSTYLFKPIVRGLSKFIQDLLKILGIESKESFYSSSEIKSLLQISLKEKTIDNEEEEIIEGILEFGDTEVGEILIPKIDIKGIDINSSPQEIMQQISETKYSRLPVYKDDLDNIIGIIYTKDLLGYIRHQEVINIYDLLRPPYFVPETKKISELLDEFRRGRIHMAIIVNEYGSTVGLITLEDILEEIVGEIYDEYEEEAKNIISLKKDEYLVYAKEDLDKINEELGISLPADEFYSLGGFLTDLFGRIPKKGEEIVFSDVKFIIEEAIPSRIVKVRIIKGVKDERN